MKTLALLALLVSTESFAIIVLPAAAVTSVIRSTRANGTSYSRNIPVRSDRRSFEKTNVRPVTRVSR
jgi:hypothetical protein